MIDDWFRRFMKSLYLSNAILFVIKNRQFRGEYRRLFNSKEKFDAQVIRVRIRQLFIYDGTYSYNNRIYNTWILSHSSK